MEKERCYVDYYNSPIGEICLGSDGEYLVGLWLEGDKYYCEGFSDVVENSSLRIFQDTEKWLDIYFSGEIPNFIPKLKQNGSEFRMEVWEILKNIPYGKTITYGKIAKEIATRHGIKRISAQAVGGAVGHNSISIIVPCHRVVGVNKELTGYAAGLDIKKYLLHLEGIHISEYKSC